MSSMIPALLLFILFALVRQPVLGAKKSYVVYLGQHSNEGILTDAKHASHSDLLSSLLASKAEAESALIYSYKRSINGFAAVLDEERAIELRKNPNVASVFEDKPNKLHTSHSWEFQLLEKNGIVHSSSLWKRAKFGKDVIIAALDSGVWPESKSFDDKGYGPIPTNWKGACMFKRNTTTSFCNKKLIGARYFNQGFLRTNGRMLNDTYNTPRDTEGHGTHTLSTAAGNMVPGANIFGFANGTIKGGSPQARAASYKVCWPPLDFSGGCFDSDILKGFDSAINDGVSVLSVSLGGSVRPYSEDATAIGSFHAVRKGIPVVASAGNNGPGNMTVSNVAPWIITVAASDIDRQFEAEVKLGNGTVLKGTTLYNKALPENKLYPLITGDRAAVVNKSIEEAKLCQGNTLDPLKAKDKIVVCLRGGNSRVSKSVEADRAGAVGFILCNDKANGNDIIADLHFLPASHISYRDGLTLFSYIENTKNPEALINPVMVRLKTKPSPRVASFSSRGPNALTPEILKPDVTAPGVNIVASYSELTNPTGSDLDKRRSPYFVLSGTSMSCPHVSGVVGLIRSLHPDWSPAAIRSALMTTARSQDNTGNPITNEDKTKATSIDYGSGHIHPNRAADPGLVYDATVDDYLNFLCGLNYSAEVIKGFAGHHYKCPAKYSILDFNNPSIAVPSLNGTVTVKRRLKNVGKPGRYDATVRSPAGYSVSVEPSTLTFWKIGEEKEFRVTITAVHRSHEFVDGHLTWSDGQHHVRSPIAAFSSSI